jgi:hypothetical protein
VRIAVSVPILVLIGLLAVAVIFLKSDYASERACALLREEASERLGADVEVAGCEVLLLPPGLMARQVRLEDGKGGRLLDATAITVELDSLSLLVGRLEVDRLLFDEPRVLLVLREGRLVNLPRPSARPAAEEEAESPDLERLVVSGGQLDLVIEDFGALRLQDIQMTVDEAEGAGQAASARAVSLATSGGSLDLAGGRGTSLPIGACLAAAVVDARGVELERLSLSVHDLHLSAQGRVGLEEGGFQPRLGLAVRGSMELLPLLLPMAPPMQGQVVVGADVSLGPNGVQAEGAVDARGYGVMTATGMDMTTRFQVDPRGLRLQDLRASSPGGRVSGEAHLDFDELLSFGGRLQIEHAELRPALGMGGIDFGMIDLRGAGPLDFRGQFLDPRGASVELELTLEAERLRVDAGLVTPVVDLSGARLKVGAVFNGRQVRFPGFVLTKDGVRIEGLGRIRFADGQVQASLLGPGLQLADLGPVTGLSLAGLLDLQIEVTGAFPVPRLDVRLGGQGVQIEQRRLGALQGRLILEGGRLLADPLVAQDRAGAIRLQGSFGLKAPHALQGQVDLEAVPLTALLAVVRAGQVPEGLGGLLGGTARVGGNLEDPDLEFQMAYSGLRLGPVVSAEGGALGRLEQGRWSLELFEARLGTGWLFARGSISRDAGLDLMAYSTGLRADAFGGLLGADPPLDFRLDLNANLRGPLRAPAFEGWAKVYDLRLGEVQLPASFVSAVASSERVEVSGRILGEAARLTGLVELATDLPFSAELELDTDLGGRFLPESGDGRAGHLGLTGRLQARGQLLEPHGIQMDLALERLAMRWAGLGLQNKDPVQASVRRGRLTLRRCALVGSGTALEVAGHLDRVSGPDLALSGNLEAGLARLVLPWVRDAAGEARLEMRLFGGWQQPRLSGQLDFKLERLRLAWLVQDLEAVQGQIKLGGADLDLTRVTARLGGGDVSLRGQLGLGVGGLRSLSLGLELERVRLELSRDLWGLVSGSLGLQRRKDGLLVLSGQLRVLEGSFREHIALVPMDQGAFRRRQPALRVYDPTREVVAFDVGLRILDRFRVDYNLDLVSYRAELMGGLQLTGTNERLGLVGELEAIEGAISYLSKDFEVSTTRVQFADPLAIRPRVEIRASRQEEVDRGDDGKTLYQIDLGLVAEGDDVRVSLRSSPPLDERDIITLLSLGVTSRDLESIKGEDLVGLGGEIVMRSFKLDERLSKLFPFPPDLIQPKYFRLRSRFSSRTGSSTPHLEAGVKLKLVGSELDLDFSRSLYDDTDQSLELSYRLSRGISTRLRWEDSEATNIGDLGLDLRFVWEF